MATALSLNRKSALLTHKTVGVLLGGTSSERAISLRSGNAVLKAFKNSGIATLRLDPARATDFKKKLQRIDVAFLALHGTKGEDGSLQHFLEKKRIPFTGSNSRASRDAFDKVRAKKKFLQAGVSTAPYTVVTRSNWRKKISRLGLPAFAKPIADGSSVGAFAIEDLLTAESVIVRHLNRFKQLLVERKINGREFTVGVLGTKALPVIEMIPGRDFFDYKAKYTPGVTQYDVPAKIKPAFAKRLQRLALKAHRCLGLRDVSRVDIMTDENENAFVLEANSIPGMTEMSLLPKAARVAGICFEDLCSDLTRRALKRERRR